MSNEVSSTGSNVAVYALKVEIHIQVRTYCSITIVESSTRYCKTFVLHVPSYWYVQEAVYVVLGLRLELTDQYSYSLTTENGGHKITPLFELRQADYYT